MLCSRLTVNNDNLLPRATGIRLNSDVVRRVVCQEISSRNFVLDNLKFALSNNVNKLQVFWGFDFINIIVWLESTGHTDVILQFSEYAGEQPMNQLLNAYLLNAFSQLRDKALAFQCSSELLRSVTDSHMVLEK